jgi:hypothetical protein
MDLNNSMREASSTISLVLEVSCKKGCNIRKLTEYTQGDSHKQNNNYIEDISLPCFEN